ncbi:complexed with cef1p [Rhodotorula toruloides]
MSSAHRPTWAPAQGKEGRQNSRSFSARDIAGHTKLKFRQPSQGTTSETSRRDLKAELLAAERDAAARKAKGERGYVADQKLLALRSAQDKEESDAASESAAKRRKLLQEAADLDKDDSDDEESEEEDGADKGKGKAVEAANDDDDDDSDSSDDDDEDETAELLRELEKIKKERAEEKERQERERAATEQISRDEEIATGNPLLNLQAALGRSPAPSTISESSAASFGVKRRWDDDVIFKNQARTEDKSNPTFINDLLRTEYHKKFIRRFVA